MITLRVFYPNERSERTERCRHVAECDILLRGGKPRAPVRCRAWLRGVGYERRFELVRDAIVRYLGPFVGVIPDVDVFVRVARNAQTEFLVLAHDESVRSKPMIPYLVVWKDDDVETVMDGELVERLDAAAAGESFWLRKKKDSITNLSARIRTSDTYCKSK